MSKEKGINMKDITLSELIEMIANCDHLTDRLKRRAKDVLGNLTSETRVMR